MSLKTLCACLLLFLPVRLLAQSGPQPENGSSKTAHPAEVHLAFHFEAAYEFEVRNVGLGPVLELGYDLKGVHLTSAWASTWGWAFDKKRVKPARDT